jgi:DNA-binding NarL/FixJ family response regulator
MINHYQDAGPIAEVSDVLATLAEQTSRWHGELTQALAQLKTLAGERPALAPVITPAPVLRGAEVELKQQIILLLAEGAKDETVARRLGLSLRTCRRHIAEILDHLDASSRFQAGYRAGRLGAVPAPVPPVSA